MGITIARCAMNGARRQSDIVRSSRRGQSATPTSDAQRRRCRGESAFKSIGTNTTNILNVQQKKIVDVKETPRIPLCSLLSLLFVSREC